MATQSSSRYRAPALDRAERQALLLRCAMQVFARRGIGAARHAEIARVAKVSVYVLVQMKVAKLPNARIERFLQTLVRDTLGEAKASLTNEAHISEFNVAVG